MIKSRIFSTMGAGLLALAFAVPASALPTATATLSTFIQDGSITNNAASGANITQIVYSLGTPEDNLATWQISTGGGTASNFLSDPQYFQTITFGGLSIAPGAGFSFFGLDIDLIQTLVPLSVTGSPVGGPETLRNAFLSITWSDGNSGTADLVEQAWATNQNLTINGASSTVPEPGTIALLGLALVGLARYRRRTA